MAILANRAEPAATDSHTVQEWCKTACAALESGTCLEVCYPAFSRIVEVHRVGISPAGAHILSGWQIRGPADERTGWKLLNLDEAAGVLPTVIPSRAPRPDYRRGAKQFLGIICQL
ncbi:MAG TPA: hypothetical protein VFI23_10740 [Rhizomicrobium sp.]|nr:hypothetical protein [Rhizomicrobium sp.]